VTASHPVNFSRKTQNQKQTEQPIRPLENLSNLLLFSRFYPKYLMDGEAAFWVIWLWVDLLMG